MRWRGAALIGLALVISACGRPRAAAPPPPPTVIVYGDSLTSGSQAAVQAGIAARRPGWRIVIRSHGGVALCDVLPQMQADGNLNARVVVVQFSGNTFTPCMAGIPGGGSPQQLAKYRADAETAASIWAGRGVKVLFVGNPLPFQSPGPLLAGPHPLDGAYAEVAQRWAWAGAAFSNAPEVALSVSNGVLPKGTMVFPFNMPCLPQEVGRSGCTLDPSDSVLKIQVRDGPQPGVAESTSRVHFCPVAGASPCPVYSSGAFRFGDAIAAAAAAMMT